MQSMKHGEPAVAEGSLARERQAAALLLGTSLWVAGSSLREVYGQAPARLGLR